MSWWSNIQKHLLFSGSSSAETLLWQKQLVPALFYLKRISLLSISATFFYLSTNPSCMSAVGEETSDPEISYCLQWKSFCPSPLSHLMPETFVSLCFMSLFHFFCFCFPAYWDHYHKFTGFDSLKPLKKY